MSIKNKTIIYTISILCLLIICFIYSLHVGIYDVTTSDIINSIFNNDGNTIHDYIYNNRLPRILAVFIVGGLLAVSGSVFQCITKNPIADSSLLGISTAAVFVIAVFVQLGISLTTFTVVVASFVGATTVGIFIFLLMNQHSTRTNPTKILLAGAAISTFFASLTTVLGLLTGDSRALGFWLAGGFRGTGWLDVIVVLIIAIICITLCIIYSKRLNLMSLGDEVATGLGINITRTRIMFLILIIVMSAISVAIGKNIAFVGIIVPHIVIAITGNNYRVVIPLTFISGALLLGISDILSITMFSPNEVPIGVFTSLIGVPFFIFVAMKARA